MNKILSVLAATLFLIGTAMAQSPESVNYQAVARDGSGVLLANTNLDVRLGIYSGPGGTTLEYEEEFTVSTNQFGLFNLRIGEGAPTFGVFSAIVWDGVENHLKVEVDAGSGYMDMGTEEIASVPYSFYANEADVATHMAMPDLIDVTAGAPSSGEVLGWTGSTWEPVDNMASPWGHNANNIYYDQGYVGVGTLTPGAGLELYSSAGYGSAIALNNVGGGLEWRITSWTDGTLRIVKTSGTTFSPIVIEPNDGYVGIGTSTPDMPLSVHTSSGISYIRVSDNTTGPSSGLRMGLSGSGNAYIINDEAVKSLSLGTDGTTQLRINADGEIGINELSPEQTLHLKQHVSNKGIRTEHNSTTDYWETGIGVTTKNYKFYYNNLFRADISSVDGAYTQSSDRRLKRDIQVMEPVLEKVAHLEPFTYHYVDNDASAPRSTGFVAQDVEAIFPDLVRDTDDGYKGLVYDGFAVISIKAIQELDAKIDAMQAEIDALKTELDNQ